MTNQLLERLQAALGEGFLVERELGRGGMSTVYLVLDRRHQRRIAVKVVNPDLGLDLAADRFQREIEVAASLNHPHIVPLLDSGTALGLRYYTMPYIEGESLRQRLDREHQLPLGESLRLARDVAAALAAAHARGLVHRDIKPENIMLSGGEAVVTDFGIARVMQSAAGVDSLTKTGLVIGTPMYMSPEQAAGNPVIDGRSDVYSLACVLYEMLVGHPPFHGTTPQEILGRHALDPVPPVRSGRPGVPEAVDLVLQEALSKSPADRLGSASDFAAILDDLRTTGTTARVRISAAGTRNWRRRPLVRRLAAVVGVLLLLILAVLAGRQFGGGPAASPGSPARLAVLPLVSVGLEDSALFAEGLTDEMTIRLARLSDLAVIARNNTLGYRNSGKTVQQIGRELGVEYVLEGQVRWSETGGTRRVRVTPSLVRVLDGAQVWSDALEGVVSDVFALQARMAQRVAEALPIRLGSSDRRTLGTAATGSVDAYREYVLARFYWQQRTGKGLERAVDHFNRALKLDPLFARAYAGLADSYILFSQYGVTSLPRDIAWTRAREAANRALALDSTQVEALASLGEIIFYSEWDWEEAESYFRRAIAADPNYATARQWYSELLTVTGRFDDAIVEADRAALLDPVSGIVSHARAIALLGARRYDEAIAQYRRVLEIDPGLGYANFGLVWAHIAERDYASAVRQMARLGDTTALARAWIRGAVDPAFRPEARRTLARARDVVEQWPAEIQASVHASVGNVDQAVAVLERTFQEKAPNPPGVKPLPLYDPIRQDPRFRELLRKMNLPI